MKKFNFLYNIVFLILFYSCEKNKNSHFIKEWESVKSIIPHKDYLKINSNHTFEFHGSACASTYESFGKWEEINDTIILNSTPSKKCQFLSGFGNNMENLNMKNYLPKSTIKDCKPEERNGMYINFINDKFYLKNDTLRYDIHFKLPFNENIDFLPKKNSL